MLYRAETLFLWFVCYSVVGWIYESALCSILNRKWINRGFLTGPVCPIYGSGAILIVLLLSGLKGNPILLFLASAFVCTTLEYLTSVGMEKLFHARWWDYSKNRWNIHGRVCLLGFVAFGAMAVLMVEFLHPLVESWTNLLRADQLQVLVLALAAAFAFDLTTTLITMFQLDTYLSKFRKALSEKVEEKIDEWMPKLSGLRRFKLRGIMKAYPYVTFQRYHPEWQKLRERLLALKEEVAGKVIGEKKDKNVP